MDEVNACIAARADQEELVDQPFMEKSKVRVSGPFTMEGIIPAEESIDDGEPEESPIGGAPEELETFGEGEGSVQTEAQNAEAYLDRMIRLLREDGVRFPDNKVMKFTTLEALADGSTLHAKGTWANGDRKERQVAVIFGPQYGPLTRRSSRTASALPRGAASTIWSSPRSASTARPRRRSRTSQTRTLRIHMAQIRPDVNMGDLLKTTVSSQLFTVSGSPRTRVEKEKDGQYVVHMEGVDIYDPVTNTRPLDGGGEGGRVVSRQRLRRALFLRVPGLLPGQERVGETGQGAGRGTGRGRLREVLRHGLAAVPGGRTQADRGQGD